MDIPTPQPALVIRYAYLWPSEQAQGRDEGSKDRPAAIVLAAAASPDGPTVVVLPITHTPPTRAADAIATRFSAVWPRMFRRKALLRVE